MKTYTATFNRYNPQLDKFYTMAHDYQAETKAKARKQAREAEDRCTYGSLTLISLELKK